MMTTLKIYLRNLNFFQSSDPVKQQDEHEQRSNIIATRIYIMIFAKILFILILALWLTPQTSRITLQYPTEDQFQALSLDANCPCSRISLSYGQFVSIQTKFHQVCSSDFITNRWIEAIFYESSGTFLYRADFRVIGGAQFRALASLCELTKASILQNLASFNTMLMISPTILSQSVVQSEAQTAIEQLQMTTTDTFEKHLEFVRKMIVGNQLISALGTNIAPVYLEWNNISLQVPFYIKYNISNGSYCNCQIDVDCRVPSGIFNEFKPYFANAIFDDNISTLMKIDGFSAGCMPMDSILQSSLQCFYNQTCLNKLLSFLSTNETFTAMKLSNQSRFTPTSTVKELIHQLMVEEWLTNISYEKYYNQCAPVVCTYSEVERHDSVYVLTKVIGVLGGLTLALTFIVPTVVRFLRRKKDSTSNVKVSLLTRFHQMQMFIKRFLLQLNLFEHSSRTHRELHYQCIATRLYISFVLISLTILTSYILATEDVQQELIINPTEEQFSNLQRLYPNSLSCPCNAISTSFNSFIKIEPLYHQLCSSNLVSQRYIDYYNSLTLYLFTSSLEFGANAGHQFQILASFCNQAQQTVNSSRQSFLQRQFVGSQVISEDIFRSQINESIEEWKANTLILFLRPIQLIRITNQGNQLMNALHNSHIGHDRISNQLIPIPVNYSTCSCARSSTCRTEMTISNYSWSMLNYVEIFHIPNFFIGCFPVESLLESTLECFYNDTCMTTIETYMNNKTALQFSSLDATRNSPNETVQSILDRLMIDSWSSNISFSTYYNMCAPSSCTYEYTRQHDIYYLISSILGVFAGLALGIKILIFVTLRSMEQIVGDFSWCGLKKRFKGIFICHNEQQITNRLHFILLLFTLIILYFVSSFTLVTRTEQVTKPSLSTYQNLVNNYPHSLQCPCLQISIEYQSFLTIVPQMHQICSSRFVSDDWIDYIYNAIDPLHVNYTDFRRIATGQYQLLASLCSLSQEVVNDGLSSRLTSSLIDSQLLSSDLLNARIQAVIKEFQMTIPNSFLNCLSFIRQATDANMLMNMFTTNSEMQYDTIFTFFYVFYMASLNYQECNCRLSSKCVQPSQGMMVGCYPLEALLQSTLECFYNQTCIDPTNTFPALNNSSTILSYYPINSTIESILNRLMVEDYSSNISYENYFAKCEPISCSYSFVGHRPTIEVTSTVIGLYGGVAVIARFLVVLFLKLCVYRRRKVGPQISSEKNGIFILS